MKKFRQNWPKYLVIFFLNCTFWGLGIAYAAPSIWSYPNDHILISEVKYTGAPGTGTGTEWIELYNPTNNDVNFESIFIWSSEGSVVIIPTPYPAKPYPPIGSQCFLYLAYDAATFYNEYKHCPDYADILDTVNCPNTNRSDHWQPDIDNNDLTLCLDIDYNNPMIDAVGWGTGGTGWSACNPVANPLLGGVVTGETYLRGSDAPEWIGPGGEGTETLGTPTSEQLDEVWNLSDSVNVPWEGPEIGVCRQPTAIRLQNPRAHTVQNSGYILSFFGLVGLITTLTVLIWRQKLAIFIEKGDYG